MALYEYTCDQNALHAHREERHDMDVTPIISCASCGYPMRRVFTSLKPILKGPGFYSTDARRTEKVQSTPPVKVSNL